MEGSKRETRPILETYSRDVDDRIEILEELGERAVRSRVSSDGLSPFPSIRVGRAGGNVGGDGVSGKEVDGDRRVSPRHWRAKRRSEDVSNRREKEKAEGKKKRRTSVNSSSVVVEADTVVGRSRIINDSASLVSCLVGSTIRDSERSGSSEESRDVAPRALKRRRNDGHCSSSLLQTMRKVTRTYSMDTSLVV